MSLDQAKVPKVAHNLMCITLPGSRTLEWKVSMVRILATTYKVIASPERD